MVDHTNLIKVTYFFRGEESSVTFDPMNKLSVLRHIISLSLKINMADYEMTYNKKQISITDERRLRDIVGNDTSPAFFIKKRTNSSSVKHENKKYFKNNVLIENFPSIMDLYDQLNLFLDQRNIPRDFTSDHKGNSCMFSFTNSDIAFEFMKFMNALKSTNPLYAKVRSTMQLDSNDEDNKRDASSINISNIENKSFKDKSSNQLLSMNYSYISKSDRLLPEYMKSKIDGPVRRKNKMVINNFYSRQNYVRISGPYQSFEEMHRNDQIESQKKWVNKHGFFTSVGKYSMKPVEIPNYVCLTPSKSPLLHEFRDVKKEKWMSVNGFH